MAAGASSEPVNQRTSNLAHAQESPSISAAGTATYDNLVFDFEDDDGYENDVMNLSDDTSFPDETSDTNSEPSESSESETGQPLNLTLNEELLLFLCCLI